MLVQLFRLPTQELWVFNLEETNFKYYKRSTTVTYDSRVAVTINRPTTLINFRAVNYDHNAFRKIDPLKLSSVIHVFIRWTTDWVLREMLKARQRWLEDKKYFQDVWSNKKRNGVPGELSGITLGSDHRSPAPWAVSSSLSEDKTFSARVQHLHSRTFRRWWNEDGKHKHTIIC